MFPVEPRFRGFFFISVLVHLLVLFFVFFRFKPDEPFDWGGGRSEGVSVYVNILPYSKSVLSADVPAVLKQPVKEGKNENGYNGDSPTPAGGSGGGYDSSGKANDSVLAKIRKRIEMVKQYPLPARRAGVEGSVELLFAIEENGEVKKISVMHSSGSDLLDKEAVATINRGVPYPYYNGEINMALRFDLGE